MKQGRMKQQALALVLLLAIGAAQAADPGCQANYKQEGSFFAGRRFSTFDVLPGVPEAAAFKRVYAEMIKSGFKVSNADKEMGILTAEYTSDLNGTPVSLPINVMIESAGKDGLKVSVNKSTPGGYATSADFQRQQMCAIVQTAAGQ